MGDLNHSKNFPDKYRPYVASEIKKKKVQFLSTRLPQTGFLPAICLQADKGTTVHNTRQFTTVAVIVPGSEALITIIYLGQPIVKSHSGRGVAESMGEELGLAMIDSSQLESGSFDGQYFHLGVPCHLTEMLSLPEQFLCTWDPLHKVGVTETHIRKDDAFKWLLGLTETCQKIYRKFNWGKSYQALVEMCEEMDMVMRNLKIFSTTRFPNSVRAVFDTLIDDFKPVVACLEDIIENNTGSSAEETTRRDDAKAVLRKIKSKSFVLGLSGTSDVYENFGHIANLCQKVDILPHERYDSVMRGVDHFAHMLSAVSHSQCQEVIMELKSSGKMDESTSVVCLWPRYHACLEELGSNSAFKGVVIKAEQLMRL